MLIEEIGDIDTEHQARIVRMMDAASDSVPRFMATSQVDLAAALEKGNVRESPE